MKAKARKLKWHFNENQKDSQHSEDPDIHIQFTLFGYETLCGLGAEGVKYGNDNYMEQTSKPVTCQQCLSIYKFSNSINL